MEYNPLKYCSNGHAEMDTLMDIKRWNANVNSVTYPQLLRAQRYI